MKKRNISTLEASLYTFGIFFVIIVIVCILVIGNGPRCAHYNCENEVTREGDYCYKHRAYRTKSSDSNKTLSSGNSNNSIGNSSTSESSYSNQTSEDGYSNSKSYSTSSSSSNKKTNSNKTYHDGYDDGYDDVYMDEDYDWDRYWEDEDYARGVDDALEDMEDGDW